MGTGDTHELGATDTNPDAGSENQATPAKAPKAMALTVGLNTLDHKHYKGSFETLQFALKDARAIGAIAASRGFQVHELLKHEATREAVLAAIDNASATLQKGDIFLLNFAGHGSQVPDTNGDETDHMDEAWCLYDCMLIDDELGLHLSAFAAGVRVVVISDSCCGGTMLCAEPLPVLPARRLPPLGAEADRKRPKADVAGHPSVFGSATDSHLDFPITERLQASATTAGTPPTSRDAVLRSRSLPMDVATATYAANSKLYDAITASVSSSTCTRGPGTALLLAACGDAQEAHEGTSHGTFTGALITTWNKGAFRGTYYDFLQAIAAQITWYQTPQYTWLYDKQDAALADQEPFTV